MALLHTDVDFNDFKEFVAQLASKRPQASRR
jgi:hypothetical protein